MNDSKSTYDYKEDRIANIDKARNHFWYVHRNKIIERLLHGFNKQTLSVLELGAGSGNIASYLNSKGYKVAASDYFQAGIDIIKSHSILAFQYDLLTNSQHHDEHMGAYDIVILGDVIEHLEAGGYLPVKVRYFMLLPGIMLSITRKLKNYLTRKKQEKFSAELNINSILNNTMKALMSIEYVIQTFIYIPFGSSIYGVGVVKDED